MITTNTNVHTIRAIAENLLDTKRLDPYISETEHLDVIDALGALIYRTIDENTLTTLTYESCSGATIDFDATEYSTLLNGGYYTSEDLLTTYYCGGLIPAICYLAYSRFVKNNSLNVTSYGVVLKQGQLSEPADTKAVMIHANEAEKIGREYLHQVYLFIVFKEGEVSGTKEKSSSKFKTIGD
jgi:hypothetical protein